MAVVAQRRDEDGVTRKMCGVVGRRDGIGVRHRVMIGYEKWVQLVSLTAKVYQYVVLI